MYGRYRGIFKDGSGGVVVAVCCDKHDKFLGASVVVICGLTESTSLEAIVCNEGLMLEQNLQLQAIKVA